MKKRILVLLAIVLAVLAIYFWLNQNPWNNLSNEKKDFAIKDTGSITQVFLAEKSGSKVLLSKNELGIWMVDNTFKADPAKIKLLLTTMHDVLVRNPISEKEHNGIVASMATKAIKAEFYTKEGILKTMYIGTPTADQSGTFMLMEGSSVPFVTHISGFVGYLTPRFYPIPIKWRSKEVFNLQPENIQSISIVYPQNPAASFELLNENPIQVKSLEKGQLIKSNSAFCKYYLAGFNQLFVEGFDEEMSPSKCDSIKSTTPYCIITQTDKNGVKTKLECYYKSVGDHTKILYDSEGNLLPYDTEKFYGIINGDSQIAYVQNYAFKRSLKLLADFKEQP